MMPNELMILWWLVYVYGLQKVNFKLNSGKLETLSVELTLENWLAK